METEIITIFCICHDYLKAISFIDNSQSRMSTAEVMTVAIVAAKFFGGNYEKARFFLRCHRYMKMLSKSQFSRRLNFIDSIVWLGLFHLLSEIFKNTHADKKFIIDTFPVPVCHNIRISRAKIYEEKQFRGYCASKRQYFFGLKVAIITTSNHELIEFAFAPGSFHDSKISKMLDYELPEGSTIFGDSAFSDQELENDLKDQKINPLFARKGNSKNSHSLWDEYLITKYRKPVETTISGITNLFPKKIHAVTANGFELKLFCFLLAYSMGHL